MPPDEPKHLPTPNPEYRREARHDDSPVVQLILARFNDVMAQIEDVRDAQNLTNAHLEKLNGRTRTVEVDIGKVKAVVGTFMFLVTMSGVSLAVMNFLKIDFADLAKLVGA